MRKSVRSSMPGSGVQVHATERRRPVFVSQVLSRSAGGSPAPTRMIASRTSSDSSGSTKVSQKTWPPISAGSYSSVSSKAMFAPCSVMTPLSSIRQRRLGAVLAIALRKARSRSFSSSSRSRSVMSIPVTRTSPSRRSDTSATGIADQANARDVPSADLSSDSTGSEAVPAAGGCDRVRGAAVVVLDDEIEEPSPDELVVRPPDRPLEGAVRADGRVVDVAVADRAVARERDHDARHRLEDRRLDISLAFELALALPAHGDVEPAGDDRGDDAGLVVVRRRSPVDDAVLASRVGERILVLPGREVGSQRCEALLDGRPLPGVDEDVPVQQADHLVLALAAGDLERGGVDVLDPAVRADDREQARHRVRHGVEELDLRAQLDLEPVASQRQSCRSGYRVEQLGLVVERRVVADRGDSPAVLLDDLHRTTGTRLRLRYGVTLRVHPAAPRGSLTLIEPVEDGELLVLQRARERVSERRPALERDDELRNRDAAQAERPDVG